jgi:site-specific recombinase XerD
MQDVTIYQDGDQDGQSAIVFTDIDPSVQDALFLRSWLFGKSEKTQRAYTGDLRKFYAHVGKPLRDVTLSDVQGFIDSLVARKDSSRARAVAAVKSCLSFAEKTGYLQVYVGAAVKLPKIENRIAERIMCEQAVSRLLALESNPRNHAMLILLYRAGLRAQEVCDLQWRHVTPREESGQLAEFGKGKKTRFVLLDADTWQELERLRPSGDVSEAYVFRSRQAFYKGRDTRRRMDESMLHIIVSRAAARAGIQGKVSPHWMRHAHATYSLENGAPITLVQATLGHASMETTAKYTHVRPNASSGQFLKV